MSILEDLGVSVHTTQPTTPRRSGPTSDMDLETSSHETLMARFGVRSDEEKSNRDDDTESMHSMQSYQSDKMSCVSTQSESKLILNDLKTKLNQQKSVWDNIKSQTSKYMELYLLNGSYDNSKEQEPIEIAETQSLTASNNEMDEKQKKLYIRLQNNLIADLMKEKNKITDKCVLIEKEHSAKVQNVKTLKQENAEKNQMIDDYKQLLSNTCNDMNKQHQLQEEINCLDEKDTFKDKELSKSAKAFATISNHLSDYINHIDHTTNYINYKMNKLNQNINKLQRKHQILVCQTKHKPNMQKKLEECQKKVSDKDEMIKDLIEQKMEFIRKTAEQFNKQRDVISQYQKERLMQNRKIWFRHYH